MEFRISQFAKWFATFMAIWFAVLVVDEFLPTSKRFTFLKEKYVVETEFSDRIQKDYWIKTNEGFDFEVQKMVFDSIQMPDKITVYFSPVFSQFRAYGVVFSQSNLSLKFGDPQELRGPHLITGLAAVLLFSISAFVAKKFELKIALFFFASLTAAVRWWILGT